MFIGHHAAGFIGKRFAPQVYGLGLWNSVPGTAAIEVALFVFALWLYLRTTTAVDRTGSVALWALVLFLGIIYLANTTSPPPPNAQLVGYAALATWPFVPWGLWIDRRRRPLT